MLKVSTQSNLKTNLSQDLNLNSKWSEFEKKGGSQNPWWPSGRIDDLTIAGGARRQIGASRADRRLRPSPWSVPVAITGQEGDQSAPNSSPPSRIRGSPWTDRIDAGLWVRTRSLGSPSSLFHSAPSVLGFGALEPWVCLLRRGLRRALSAVVFSSVGEDGPIAVGWPTGGSGYPGGIDSGWGVENRPIWIGQMRVYIRVLNLERRGWIVRITIDCCLWRGGI
jgi:hypothetical protein